MLTLDWSDESAEDLKRVKKSVTKRREAVKIDSDEEGSEGGEQKPRRPRRLVSLRAVIVFFPINIKRSVAV